VPVVLTGEGGDELLGGYPRYAWFLFSKKLQRVLPAMVLRALLPIGRRLPVSQHYKKALQNVLADRNNVDRHISWIASFDPPLGRAMLSSEFQSMSSATHDLVASHLGTEDGTELVSRLLALDMHTWLVDDILTKADKMSMAASVEARVPFLDHRLVEFVLSLPGSSRREMLGTKRLLREAMVGLLPSETLTQPKQAFLVPVDQWLRGHLSAFLRDTLLSTTARQRGWFQPKQVERLLDVHQAGRASYGRQLWNLLCLELWASQFLDGAATN
jgi:asparagine synthase (glutamine-hydrolysing)